MRRPRNWLFSKMNNVKNKFLVEISSYYNAKLAENGETPKGVDWNSLESQSKRFDQLCRIFLLDNPNFTVNDLGCGYAACLDHLLSKKVACRYIGIDISEKMIDAAKKRHAKTKNARFIVESKPDQIADYSIASGIFNVRLEKSDHDWLNYISDTLNVLDKSSLKGFSFNCLSSFAESDKKKNYLYYADPLFLIQLCMQRYSRNVALLHDYGLFEFTVLVRKNL